LKGIYQLLLHTDDFRPPCKYINKIEKNADTLFMGGKEDDLQVNTQKTEYMVFSRHQRKMRK